MIRKKGAGRSRRPHFAPGITRLVSIEKRLIRVCGNLSLSAPRLGVWAPMPFTNYRDNFDPETLAVLEIAFNEAWEVLLASGGDFDQKATRSPRRANYQLRG